MTDKTQQPVHADEIGLGLQQVRYILKSVANGDDQSAIAPKAIEIIDAAAALLVSNRPPEQLVDQISKLLGNDPLCSGRVCSETVEAIAGLVSNRSGVEDLKHDLDRYMKIANIECNEAERLREALARAEEFLRRLADGDAMVMAETVEEEANALRTALDTEKEK